MIRINEDVFSQDEEEKMVKGFSEIFSHINAIIAIAQNCPHYEELVLEFEKYQRHLKSHRL